MTAYVEEAVAEELVADREYQFSAAIEPQALSGIDTSSSPVPTPTVRKEFPETWLWEEITPER